MKKKPFRKPSKGLAGSLAKNIRDLRHAHNLSQEKLAELSGLHRTYIGSVERAERNVTLSSIELIAQALDVTIIDLLTPSKEIKK